MHYIVKSNAYLALFADKHKHSSRSQSSFPHQTGSSMSTGYFRSWSGSKSLYSQIFFKEFLSLKIKG